MSVPRYVSTRGGAPPVPFEAALLRGLAPDGGLYVPTSVPALPDGWDAPGPFAALAACVLAPWLEQDGLTELVADALPFPVPVVELGPAEPGVWVAELFHGPTLSFKDVGARTMARLVARARREPVTILVATSGDTGSAVADGFAGAPGVRVVLMYPDGGVSDVQARQLTASRPGVVALAVAGTFDDCQRLAKEAFAAEIPGLSSANSINVGRLLPQMTYHAAAARAVPGAVVVVPSGNLGNLTAGVLARQMGAPIAGFVAAHNGNDAFPRFLADGTEPSGASRRTLSNAMDVGVPSNLERLRALVPDLPALVRGETVSDDETLATIADVQASTGYLADPHTAVGLTAARRLRAAGEARPLVVLATAHPAKFPDAIARATGAAPPVPPALDLPPATPTATIAPDLDALAPWLGA